ncbi:hypothetical protein A8C32_15920 [Flavivirga aquatica]|uniref:Cytochrome c domain-containing protein n=1 Tax=Flavivirga aquatica TaxID=1849968 RepID=A0A1E5T9A5_9FLAO|nr:hypothetical protein [Flavivirga aquatica]OEK07951.1 hypothetical protein A8C32_15920 [Flavivirga aquatica]
MKISKYLVLSFCSIVLVTSCDNKEEKKKGFTYEKQETKSKKTNESKVAVLTDGEVQPLLAKNTCIACHKKDEKAVGPSYGEIAKRNYSNQRIVELIYKPEPENWPEYKVPMIALPHVSKGEALKIAVWINSLKE